MVQTLQKLLKHLRTKQVDMKMGCLLKKKHSKQTCLVQNTTTILVQNTTTIYIRPLLVYRRIEKFHLALILSHQDFSLKSLKYKFFTRGENI